MRKKKSLKKNGSSKRRFRIKRKKSIFRTKSFWLFILCFCLIIGVAYLLLFSDFFQIKKIEISGNREVSELDIQRMIEREINKRILFKTRSIFLVQPDEMEEMLLEKFFRVGAIVVKRKLPDHLNLQVEERNTFAIVCQSLNCWLIDVNGVVFEEIVSEQEKAQDRFVISVRKEQEISLGQEVIRPDYLYSISQIQDRFKERLGLEIRELLFFDRRLNLKTGLGFDIFFDLEESYQDQIFNLDVVLKEKIKPEELSNLDYIDLRFGNKIYYK